jgi:hypothetical protein
MTWIARDTFVAEYDDEVVRISKGERLADDHELARTPAAAFRCKRSTSSTRR